MFPQSNSVTNLFYMSLAKAEDFADDNASSQSPPIEIARTSIC